MLDLRSDMLVLDAVLAECTKAAEVFALRRKLLSPTKSAPPLLSHSGSKSSRVSQENAEPLSVQGAYRATVTASGTGPSGEYGSTPPKGLLRRLLGTVIRWIGVKRPPE